MGITKSPWFETQAIYKSVFLLLVVGIWAAVLVKYQFLKDYSKIATYSNHMNIEESSKPENWT